MIKQIQELLNILLFPKKRWIFLCDILSFISLFYIFTHSLDENVYAYFIYALAFYSLIITGISLFGFTIKVRECIFSNHHVSKYYSDLQYRMKIRLYVSLSINILYAVFKLLMGGIYQSIWEIHLGTYYLIICIVRFILLRQINYSEIGKDKEREYQKYKLCSYFLIILNIILTGVVILMVWRNYTYQYPGYIIYLAAMYTFYTAISAVYNMIKFYRHHSPLINAINIICFITALVSVLSLQTAMLTQFGTEGVAGKQMANGITGIVICTIIFIVTTYMIVHAKIALKKLALNYNVK